MNNGMQLKHVYTFYFYFYPICNEKKKLMCETIESQNEKEETTTTC